MAKYEVVTSGFGVVEGPTLDPDGGLLFSDIPRGGVYRLAPSGEVETVLPKRRGVGGMCPHRDGGVVISGRDISHLKDGELRLLFTAEDCPPPGPVAGFNDLCADHRGRVLIGPTQLNEQGEKVPQNLIRVTAPHQGEVLYGDVYTSNGVAVDGGRRRIFHSETRARQIIVSEFDDDDRVTIVRRFSTAEIEGMPDGLRLDHEGCPWVAFYDGGAVVRFSPEGEVLQELRPPSRFTTSVCFAGPQMKDLYIGSHDNLEKPELEGCLFLTEAPVAGMPVFAASI